MNWKSNTLIFLTYNNYYNRIVKKEKTLQDYLEYELFRLSATNFNPADGVNTVHRVNMIDGLYPDYVITIDEYNNIVSRWFIIESNRIRGGQYDLTLHRDTVADYYEDITSAPCFIEKATLNYDDPLIFNEEDMSFNQIKTQEILLKDKSDSAWLVGYYSKTLSGDFKGAIDFNNPTDLPYKTLTYQSITQWPLYGHSEEPIELFSGKGTYNIKARFSNIQYLSGELKVDFDNLAASANELPETGVAVLEYPLIANSTNWTEKVPAAIAAFGKNSLKNNINAYLPEQDISLEEFLEYPSGTLVKTVDNRYYEIAVIPKKQIKKVISIPSGSLFNALATVVDNADIGGTPNTSSFSIECIYNTYTIDIRERQDLNLNYDLSGEKLITEDSPYNIFAIPLKEFLQIETVEGNTIKNIWNNSDIALATISSISKNHAGHIYDIQLLPYCPIPDLIRIDGIIRISNNLQASPITKGIEENAEIVGYIFNVPKSHFSINIDMPIEQAATAIEKKVNNQCNKYRLCSPNFNGYFDFSVEKNNGVQYFNVDCHYKPYQPYIHVNPNFNGLYGQDFNDPRGLICGGDFSLTQIVDKWQEYQIQNKNFQEIFNRQIENLEVQNKYQRIQDISNAIAGTVQGGMTGASTGLLASGGNPYAAIGGAVGGTIASGMAGITDIKINQMLRNEAIDFTKDNFGYQLGNIQALPYVLTKVSSLNNNNKIFPLLEYYTCTDREKEALRDKLKYNGMTVMAIGTIGDYIKAEPSYIKGKIIRLPEINEDYHIANEIAREINLGIYI